MAELTPEEIEKLDDIVIECLKLVTDKIKKDYPLADNRFKEKDVIVIMKELAIPLIAPYLGIQQEQEIGKELDKIIGRIKLETKNFRKINFGI